MSVRICLPTVATALLLSACGPSKLALNPQQVVNVSVQPASGQALFCPGDAFQIELVAKLSDGTLCSNLDGDKGCMSEKNSIIDPALVRIDAGPGAFTDMSKFVFTPPVNPLETAEAGIMLRGWVEQGGIKSMVGERRVSPVYDCQRDYVATLPQPGKNGENGQPGPELTVSVTSLSTPWFPNAALVRIENGTEKIYFISPSADRRIRVVSKGQDGAQGAAGAPGAVGTPGQSTGAACSTGTDGGPGLAGGPGGNGGNGGPGGRIRLVVDDAKAEMLKSRVLLESVGGAAGAAGASGPGGAGGKGGAAGADEGKCGGVAPAAGKDGALGQPGPSGKAGQAGPNGPATEQSAGARSTLFAAELPTISKVEAAKAAGKPAAP